MSSVPLSILIYGDFHPDRLGASYERAFVELGHTVIRYDVRELAGDLRFWLRNRVGHRLTASNLALRRAGAAGLNARLLDVAAGVSPDLVLVLNGDLLVPETLNRLRAGGTPVFIFHADNPFPPHRSSRPETLPAALACDCYLIWSRRLAQRLTDLGVRRVRYLPFAWDEAVFPPARPASSPDLDVIFIGGWDRHRESVLQDIARRFDLKIWGPPYWGTRTRPRSPLRSCWQGRAVAGTEAAALMARSRVVLNVLRLQNLPDGTIMRTFEVPGCGAFALSTRTAGALDIFPEGRAGAYFEGVEECCFQIERYLGVPDERDKIARAAHEIVQRHRYVDRARAILEEYAGIRTPELRVAP